MNFPTPPRRATFQDTYPWKRLCDQAQDARRDGRWTDCISVLRVLAKHAPYDRKYFQDSLQQIVSIRNAYLHDDEPFLEYRDDRHAGYWDDDPYNSITDWQLHPESDKWAAWIEGRQNWPYINDTEDFAGRYEWAEISMDRQMRKFRHELTRR